MPARLKDCYYGGLNRSIGDMGSSVGDVEGLTLRIMAFQIKIDSTVPIWSLGLDNVWVLGVALGSLETW